MDAGPGRVPLVSVDVLAGPTSILLLLNFLFISSLVWSASLCVVLALTPVLLAVIRTVSQAGARSLPAVLPYAATAGLGDAPVQVDHDGHREVKSCYGCPKRHRRVGEELDVALIWWDGSPPNNELPEQDGRSPQNEGQDPGGGDHQACHLGAAPHRVAQGFGDDEKVHD